MDARLGFIRGLARDVVRRRGEIRRRFSDVADRVLLSRPVGIPAFLSVMFAVFWLTVRLTQPLVDFIDSVFGALLVRQTRVWLTAFGAPDFLIALLSDGAGAGLTTVATFMPPICMIFLCLTLLEESGYMARAAFIMDRFLNGIGLPGKAFIPLLVGFGCTVPALMATRTLEHRRARVLTMLIAPFMSCGARMPVYAIFAMAFFERTGNWVIFALYLMGGLLAILSGLVLHRTLLKGEAAAFVMELPPYHVPALRGCLEHVWGNLKSFLTRAGQVIVLIALLLSLGHVLLDRASGDAERAAAWRVSAGRAMTVMLRPMGISEENWPAAAGLLAGLMAKEAIVGTLEVLYAHEDDALEAAPFDLGLAITDAGRQLVAAYGFAATAAADSAQEGGSAAGGGGLLTAMRRNFGSRSAAFAYLLFVLIYSPCVAALIVLAREAGWRWMLFAVVYQTLLAWMVATVFYQLANCAEAPLRAVLWVGGLAAAAAFGYGLLRIVGKRVVV